MSNVKKAFQPIVDVLEANKDAKVSQILGQILELAAAKVNRTSGEVAVYDTKGKVVALYDYFLKRWMPVVGTKAVEFAPKAGTTTGFQGMSKVGMSLWTSQQRVAKQNELNILKQVSKGELPVDQIEAKQAEIEAARKATPTVDAQGNPITNYGFGTMEELIAYLTEAKVKIGEAPVKEAKAA